MSKRDNMLLVADMLGSARKIKNYTLSYTLEDFLADDKLELLFWIDPNFKPIRFLNF